MGFFAELVGKIFSLKGPSTWRTDEELRTGTVAPQSTPTEVPPPYGELAEENGEDWLDSLFFTVTTDEAPSARSSILTRPREDERVDSKFLSSEKKKERWLRRCLIEIMAYFLEANISLLVEALGKEHGPVLGKPDTEWSILSFVERQELLRHARLISRLESAVNCGRWLLTPDWERDIVKKNVLEPTRALLQDCGCRFDSYGCSMDHKPYILDLIGTYAGHQCDSQKHKAAQDSRYGPRTSEQNILSGYMDFIEAISPNQDVRFVLGKALVCLQDKTALKGMNVMSANKPKRYLTCHIRDEIKDLYEAMGYD